MSRIYATDFVVLIDDGGGRRVRNLLRESVSRRVFASWHGGRLRVRMRTPCEREWRRAGSGGQKITAHGVIIPILTCSTGRKPGARTSPGGTPTTPPRCQSLAGQILQQPIELVPSAGVPVPVTLGRPPIGPRRWFPGRLHQGRSFAAHAATFSCSPSTR
jgi:hypothetical protein